MPDQPGQPTKYESRFAHMAREMIEISGFSIAKLAKVLGVAPRTIHNWMNSNDEFLHSIKQGRKHYEGIKIHRALVKRAEGFRYTEVTREPTSNIDPETGKPIMLVTKKVSKMVVPDVAAIKHWQINMDQANWADRKDVKVSGVLGLKEALDEAEESMGVIPGDDE